jgi:hypothetical protein
MSRLIKELRRVKRWFYTCSIPQLKRCKRR